MPRQSSGNFDQKKYIANWKKENMKAVKATFRNDFVDSFKEACQILNVSQSEVIKRAMQETIKKAGL